MINYQQFPGWLFKHLKFLTFNVSEPASRLPRVTEVMTQMMAELVTVLVVMTMALMLTLRPRCHSRLWPVNTRLRPRVMRALRVRSTTLSSAALFSPGHG